MTVDGIPSPLPQIYKFPSLTISPRYRTPTEPLDSEERTSEGWGSIGLHFYDRVRTLSTTSGRDGIHTTRDKDPCVDGLCSERSTRRRRTPQRFPTTSLSRQVVKEMKEKICAEGRKGVEEPRDGPCLSWQTQDWPSVTVWNSTCIVHRIPISSRFLPPRYPSSSLTEEDLRERTLSNRGRSRKNVVDTHPTFPLKEERQGKGPYSLLLYFLLPVHVPFLWGEGSGSSAPLSPGSFVRPLSKV